MSDEFPPGFFERTDDTDDASFYAVPRFVTHVDEGAIAMVGELYEELGIRGEVLDLMGSWVSHFRVAPAGLTVLGMNRDELAANPQASAWVVHDLNTDPTLPFATDAFDDAVCCVSVDYLTRPVEVFREVARVVRPGGRFLCTFSNRLFPTKAIRGWPRRTAQRTNGSSPNTSAPPVGSRKQPCAIAHRSNTSAIRCSRSGRASVESYAVELTQRLRCSAKYVTAVVDVLERVGQPKPDAPHRQQKVGVCRIAFDVPANPPNVRGEPFTVVGYRIGPHRTLQSALRHDRAVGLDQHAQDLEFQSQ